MRLLQINLIKNCRTKERETNIKHAGKCSLEIRGKIVTNSVKEAIRIADADESFREHINKKHKHRADFIDAKTRGIFSNKKATASIIKYSHVYNNCGTRDAVINKNLKGSECPRCSEPETWEHVVQCKETKNYRKDFVKELAIKMLKEIRNEVKK